MAGNVARNPRLDHRHNLSLRYVVAPAAKRVATPSIFNRISSGPSNMATADPLDPSGAASPALLARFHSLGSIAQVCRPNNKPAATAFMVNRFLCRTTRHRTCSAPPITPKPPRPCGIPAQVLLATLLPQPAARVGAALLERAPVRKR